MEAHTDMCCMEDTEIGFHPWALDCVTCVIARVKLDMEEEEGRRVRHLTIVLPKRVGQSTAHARLMGLNQEMLAVVPQQFW